MGGYNNIIPARFLGDIISLSQKKRIAIQKGEDRVKPNKLFVYGILKQGFSLDLTKEGATFLGKAILQGANLYRIGQGVGLRIEDEGKVYGEVFEIPSALWHWLDRIENHPHTYQRQLVQVLMIEGYDEHLSEKQHPEAWVYVHQHPEYFSGLIESGKYEADGEYARG